MKGNMASTLALHGTAAGGQSDGSSLIGRKYLVRDAKYGHPLSEYDTPEEAENAMLARPYSKVTSQPDIAQTPKVRDLARKRLVKTNPDIDAGGPGSGRRPGFGKAGREQLNKFHDQLTKQGYTYVRSERFKGHAANIHYYRKGSEQSTTDPKSPRNSAAIKEYHGGWPAHEVTKMKL